MARRSDGLALHRALSDRLLPALVAAMTFLAALALAGAVGASLLAGRWSAGASSVLTVQVPRADADAAIGGGTRIAAVMHGLETDPAVETAQRLDAQALSRLLAPWLGEAPSAQGPGDAPLAQGPEDAPLAQGPGKMPPAQGPAEAPIQPGLMAVLPLPAVVEVRLRPGQVVPADLTQRLGRLAPDTLVERSGDWSDRLVVLTTSLQACAGLALLVVAAVAASVVAVATRAGLANRRSAIEIVHGLGATDGYIAGRFAARATWLAVLGGLAGTALSVPLLLVLCRLAAPFAAPGVPMAGPSDAIGFARVPLPLWIGLPLLPMVAAVIGWGTAQATVRTWLRRLP